MCADKVGQTAQWRSPNREGFLKEVGDWLLGGGRSESTASMRPPPPGESEVCGAGREERPGRGESRNQAMKGLVISILF